MQDNEMQPIPLEEVIAKPNVLMDYYVRLSANKFIRVAKAGMNTPVDSLLRYKTKNLPCIYVKLNEYLFFIRQTINTAGQMAKEEGLSEITRLKLLDEAMAAVYREVEAIGFDEDVFKHAKIVNHGTLSFIMERPALAEIVTKFAQYSETDMKHSMMVSLVSTMLGVAHSWTMPSTLEKLALGGLLHDVGKVKVPKEILEKPIDKMSNDDKLIFTSHSEAGKQMLTQSKSVPDDVALVVLEHHERADGSGYPQGLKDFQISPLARIVGLANEFVERREENGEGVNEGTVKRVIDRIERMSGKFNKDAIKALRKLLEEKKIQAAG